MEQQPLTADEEKNKENLKVASAWVEKEIRATLEKRADKEAQLDHLEAVNANTQEIFTALNDDVPPSEVEKSKIEIFTWAHDSGKWVADEVVNHMKTQNAKKEEIFQMLKLSDQDKSILSKTLEENLDKSTEFHRRDIAHHLLSVYWLAMKRETTPELANIDNQDFLDIADMIVSHQFGDYYQRRARELGYTEDEIKAIKHIVPAPHDERTSLIAASHDGDLLNMTQVGVVDGEGQFRLGGYAKITLINVNFLLNPNEPRITTLAEAFASSDRSVDAVGGELLTQKAHEMYANSKQKTTILRETILSPKHEDLVKSLVKGSPDSQQKQQQVKDALTKEAEALITQQTALQQVP